MYFLKHFLNHFWSENAKKSAQNAILITYWSQNLFRIFKNKPKNRVCVWKTKNSSRERRKNFFTFSVAKFSMDL